MGASTAPHIILLAYGDFNPITKGHLDMFESARADLHSGGNVCVIGGLIAPCHDSSNKQTLLPSHHRLTMCHLAVRSSHWIRVDPWACLQERPQSARTVLEHHRNLLKQMSGCIFCDVTSPASSQPSETPLRERADGAGSAAARQPAPRVPPRAGLPAGKPTPARILSGLGDSVTCCAPSNADAFSFIDENANMGNVLRYEDIDMRVMLLCGSDLLESFSIPNLWSQKDLEVMVGDFGLVCVPRGGHDPSRIIAQSPLLTKYRHNIITVTSGISAGGSVISSSESRLAVARGDASLTRLLNQPVIDYVLHNRLYVVDTSTTTATTATGREATNGAAGGGRAAMA